MALRKMLAVILFRDFSLQLLLYWCKKISTVNLQCGTHFNTHELYICAMALLYKNDSVNALCGLSGERGGSKRRDSHIKNFF